MIKKKLKGSIELQRNHQILKMTATETDKPFAFKITCPERTMYVYAGSEEDMNDWIRVLRKAIPPEKGAVKLSDANLKTGDLVFFSFNSSSTYIDRSWLNLIDYTHCGIILVAKHIPATMMSDQDKEAWMRNEELEFDPDAPFVYYITGRGVTCALLYTVIKHFAPSELCYFRKTKKLIAIKPLDALQRFLGSAIYRNYDARFLEIAQMLNIQTQIGDNEKSDLSGIVSSEFLAELLIQTGHISNNTNLTSWTPRDFLAAADKLPTSEYESQEFRLCL